MSLKKLLGVLLPLIAVALMVQSATAAAAVSQLTGVSVSTKGGATVLLVRATGPFTHTEYRPTDNLLLVDLAGVQAGKLENATQEVSSTAMRSYRVIAYKGSGGAEVTRLEVMLVAGTQINIGEHAHAISVKITKSGEAENKTAPARPARRRPDFGGEREEVAGAVQVRDIQVSRGSDGMNVDILTSALVQAKAMRLTGPDRLVLDLPNTVPAKRRELRVEQGALEMIRMAQNQIEPPVTRIVLDLKEAAEYEVSSSSDRIQVKLRNAQQPAIALAADATVAAPKPPSIAEIASLSPSALSLPAQSQQVTVAQAAQSQAPPANAGPSAVAQKTAQDFVMVDPQYKPVPNGSAPGTAQAIPAQPDRAAEAASKFGPSDSVVPELPANASLKNTGLNMAALQAQQAPAVQSQQSGCGSGRYTGEPISVNLKEVDLRDFFRLIHEISGLNIVLDPQVRGSLTIVLDDVPWDQALHIVLRNNNLDCQLEGNVLRIATVDTMRREADARRAQVDAQALAVPKISVTRYLSYARARDLVPTIKKFLSQRGDVIADERMNALIIEDIPNAIPNADRLIRDLDRKTQEVEIEARVVAATRSFARSIGTQLGFGLGNNPTAVGGAGSVGTSPLFTNGLSPRYIITGGGTGGGQQIPLFSNLPVNGPTSGLSFINATNNYRLDFILTMAESRGLLKVLSRPRIVTQNNIQAVVRQGTKIPIVTAAQLGGPPTTTYVDAFLRLTVTPQITAEGTIFLALDVENTTPDFGRTVGGNPTLLVQQATTQVLVNDGGTVVIGGVIRTQNSVDVAQVPLLGDIPVLGNLFKRRTVSTETQELIFFVSPKIIPT